MREDAFEIFGVGVKWYGIIISFAMLLGLLLAMKQAKKQGINQDHILDIGIFVIPAAIIGARLYYVLFKWNEYYKYYPSEIFDFRSGGMAIHGGVLAGVLVGYLVCKFKKLSFPKIADIMAPSIILGQAIGRWGNYVNQEAYGTPTDLPWGIMIDGVRVHPTFFYEFLFNILTFVFLIYYKNKKKADGEILLLYFILYSIGRSFVEILRTDSLWLIPDKFKAVHFISILIIATSAYFFIRIRKNFSRETKIETEGETNNE